MKRKRRSRDSTRRSPSANLVVAFSAKGHVAHFRDALADERERVYGRSQGRARERHRSAMNNSWQDNNGAL